MKGVSLCLLLCLLSLCLHASENILRSLPGRNVKIPCPRGDSFPGMKWYRQLTKQPPVHISIPVYSHYSVYSQESSHYELGENQTLQVNNVDSRDEGTYYCGHLENEVIIFCKGVRLIIGEIQEIPETTSSDNSHYWLFIVLGVLLLAVTCVAVCAVYKLRFSGKRSSNNDQKQTSTSVVSTVNGVPEGDYQELAYNHQSIYHVCDNRAEVQMPKR
ncbi:uncharacterized protein LOC120514969 [Polypterus senegalus]|uniref:uncharacterized protein LOC120514969 n=1 Tax=Polypterus senegalus TaxID=55291 RepID=UPI00196354C1|nr:uncharacterized protein LOC120514969 [Polypterus senegalus]